MLREYQKRGEADIYKAWETFRRVMFQMPTGGGKTVNVTNIARRAVGEGRRVLFMAHREELISQAWETFKRHEVFAGIIKADVRPNYSLKAQIGSVQTMIRRAKLPPADFVIIDEAHHAIEDNSYGKLIKDHYPDSLILGVTATPYRLNGKGFTRMFDTLVETIQIKDLINDGYLVPIRYMVAFNPDMSNVRIDKGDYNIEDTVGVMGHAPIVQSYLEHCVGLSGMVFAVNVEHSKKIVDDYKAAGITAAHLDATTPDPLRRKILADFRAKTIKVVSNVGIATEGFDVPDMDFVQLARPTKSLSLFLQMVGRATRVNNELIKDVFSAEERRLIIASSKKPHCIILDNAGLYREHGLPDESHNWQRHFVGYSRKKKRPFEQLIEIIEFVADDGKGGTVRSELPEEVEGLKLIEINKSIKTQNVDFSSLTVLDDAFRLARNLKNIKKIGWFAFEKYMSHCRKSGLVVTDDIWEVLLKRLYHDPRDKELAELAKFNDLVEAIRLQFSDSEAAALEIVAAEFVDKVVKSIKSEALPKGELIRQRKDYFDQLTHTLNESAKNLDSSQGVQAHAASVAST